MMPVPLLLVTCTALLLTSGCKESISDKAFGDKVHRYLIANPEVLKEMAEALDKKEAQDRTTALRGLIRRHRAELERDPRDFVANPAGKITVVEFFDYNCGYCKLAAPDILEIIKSDPDIRFVFKELPVVGGIPSERASRIALAVKETKGDYLGVFADFNRARPLNNAAIDQITAARGLNASALEALAGSGEAARHIARTKALAQDMGLNGTPMFIIGDEVIEGSNMPELRRAIARAKQR